jgi:hypothetical protein
MSGDGVFIKTCHLLTDISLKLDAPMGSGITGAPFQFIKNVFILNRIFDDNSFSFQRLSPWSKKYL